jgi:D-amino-acid dehydrogenase
VRLIIVGAGIAGSAAAYAAATLGADVTLVDANHTGRATAAGAGIVCPWASRVDDPDWYVLACSAARAYPSLVEALAEAGETLLGYRRVGAMVLADSVAEQAEIRARLLARQPDWPEMGEITALDGDQARALFPPLRPDALAVHIGGGARVDGRLISAALRRAAGRAGATVRAGHAELRVSGGRGEGVTATGVTVDGEFIEGDAVIAATGTWTDQFLAPAGLTLGITPQRGQITHLSLGLTDTSRWPVVLPGGSGHYLVAFDDSRVVVGATRETGAGLDYRLTAGGLTEVLDNALSVAPGLSTGTYLETRIGFRPMGPGVRPVLGRAPGTEGLVIATGLGASGLTMGPYSGELAARAALGLDLPCDLAPFRPASVAS